MKTFTSTWLVVGIALLVVKAASVLFEQHQFCVAPRWCEVAWLIGKVTPALICFAFYNEALASGKNTRVFWLWMLAIVPAFTILVIARRGLGL